MYIYSSQYLIVLKLNNVISISVTKHKMAAQYLMQETIWTDQLRVEEAERFYYEKLAQGNNGDCSKQASVTYKTSIANIQTRTQLRLNQCPFICYIDYFV